MAKIENMKFEDAVAILWKKLCPASVMQLASSVDNLVYLRTISAIVYEDQNKIMFKTDMNFEKTKQLAINNNVAMCKSGVSLQGIATNLGLVVEEPGRRFEALYEKYMKGSYNAYTHEDTEVLIAVEPTNVEIWDWDEQHYSYQILINFAEKTAEKHWYDEH